MKLRHFLSQIQSPFFSTKFCYQTKLRVLISIMTQLFKILAEKYPNKAFWCQIQTFLFFRTILQLDKFEGADFKYDIIVFNFQAKYTQIRHFWSQIQEFLFFHQIFQIHKFEGADFKYDDCFFKKMDPRKYPNKEFLVKNTEIGICGPKSSHICFFRKF